MKSINKSCNAGDNCISYISLNSKVNIFLYACIIVHSIVFIMKHYYGERSSIVYAGFIIIGLLSFYGAVREKQCISINKIVYIFSYIFFFLAPWQQYSEGSRPMWPGVFLHYSDQLYLKANLAIGLFLIFFLITSILFKKKTIDSARSVDVFWPGTLTIRTRCILTIASIGALFLLLFSGNLEGHGMLVSNVNVNFQLLSMLRFVPGYALLVYGTVYNRKNPVDRIKSILQCKETLLILVCFFIIYNPLYGWSSRMKWMIPFTIILAMLFYDCKLNSLLFFIMYSVLVILFTSLKQITLSSIDWRVFFGNTNLNYYDYDAYQLLMTIISYTDEMGITHGKNLLSALAFIIPRSIWTGKMDATGSLAITFWGSAEWNVSAPLVSELYFSGKWIGCIIGAIVLAILFSIIDRWCESNSIIKRGVFCILSGEILYICRGALLPTLSFTLGMLLPLFVVAIFFKILHSFNISKKDRSV